MNDVSTLKWGKAASQEMHLGGVYVCRICNMWVEHGSDDCPHSNTSKDAVPPAMQRASAEAQFNVVGDELRKLTNHIIRLEAQLTTLRADADKGREALEQAVKEPLSFLVNGIMSLHDEHKELQRWIEGINKAVHIPLNRENAERQQRQSEQSLANMKISKICPQCGQPYSASACGPTHAIVWSEMKRRRAARKKKQERKRARK